jgi:hypothetical protein
MGRTTPTFREFLERYETRWQPYRRALRRDHQGAFDALFDNARGHADAAGHANATRPETAILLSMLLAHQRELRTLRERVAALETAEGDADTTDRHGA